MIEASFWTIEHVQSGVTKTAEQWAIDTGSITRELRSLDADVMMFDALVAFDSDPAFNVDDTLIVRKGGIGFFQGRVTRNDRLGEPGRESIHYELAGPW